MTILTATQLRDHLETDLGDTALTRLASAAEQVIIGAIGSVSQQVDYLVGGGKDIYVTREISSIASIKERDYPDDVQVAIAADDYRQYGKWRITRLSQGTNPRLTWAPEVEITYVPAVNTALIESVQINLVKLAVAFSGARRESDGEFDFWREDSAAETRSVLLPLTRGGTSMGIR